MATVLLVLVTALLSAGFTALLLVVVFRRRILPELEQRLGERLEAAREDFAQSVERSVRKGFLDGVSSLPSREMLQDTTRTIARTGMGLVGDSLNTLLGGRRGSQKPGERQKPAGDGGDAT